MKIAELDEVFKTSGNIVAPSYVKPKNITLPIPEWMGTVELLHRCVEFSKESPIGHRGRYLQKINNLERWIFCEIEDMRNGVARVDLPNNDDVPAIFPRFSEDDKIELDEARLELQRAFDKIRELLIINR